MDYRSASTYYFKGEQGFIRLVPPPIFPAAQNLPP